MNETTIRLPDGTVNYLQRLDYELGGLQVLHTHALNAGTPLERRMEIRREFQETFAEYQLAKQEMLVQVDPYKLSEACLMVLIIYRQIYQHPFPFGLSLRLTI